MSIRKLVALTAAVGLTVGALTPLLAGPPGGDLAAQQKQQKWKIDKIPPAPVLAPEEALRSFKLPPGYRLELVASEPLVEEPIAMAFDPDGRIYVVELRGYMPDTKGGQSELEPVGRVTLLEDTDGDGRMDKATRFMDKLVAPRAVAVVADGVLVAEPPNLWFSKDTDGDGVADKKDLIASDYGRKSPNPEHMANGLTHGLDNWIYSSNYPSRFKYNPAKKGFLRDGSSAKGQWGLTQDDVGRFYYNSNSTMLRADLAPSQYLGRNPYLGGAAGLNVSLAPGKVYPSRVNPGVNRGYTGIVNEQGYLNSVTAACGPVVYRGDKLPAEMLGNALVCEPAANLVVRHTITQSGVALTGKSIQHGSGGQNDGPVDFLTSTDERFRPVNMYTAPDGTLYVVDLYRGILQHAAYLTSYLKNQVEQRGLDKGLHLGRIYRVVHESAKPGPQPKLSKAPTAELVKALSHPNGWWRETAQRLIVERQDPAAAALLLDVLTNKVQAGVTPLGRMHAVWALEGLGKLDDETAALAMKDADPRVRVAAIRAGEPRLREVGEALKALIGLAGDADDSVQLQVLISAGTINSAEARAALLSTLTKQIGSPVFRTAALSGVVGRELELLDMLLKDEKFVAKMKGADAKNAAAILNDLSECVIKSRSADRVDKLLTLIANQPAGHASAQQALLAGVVDAIMPPAKGAAPRRLRLKTEPAGLIKLHASSDKKLAELAGKAEVGMSWPGKPGDNTPPLTPLTPDEDKRFTAGREFYASVCAQCHQPSGLGQDGVAPALADSEWVLGPDSRLVRIILQGVQGPIKVGKKTMDLEMPGLGAAMTDDQVAAVVTYLRREWGHEGHAMTPAAVAEIRKATAGRGEQQWTAEELMKLK